MMDGKNDDNEKHMDIYESKGDWLEWGWQNAGSTQDQFYAVMVSVLVLRPKVLRPKVLVLVLILT